MSYRSTPENRHFGAGFTSVGGVEAEISMSQNTEKDWKKSTSGTSVMTVVMTSVALCDPRTFLYQTGGMVLMSVLVS